MFLSYFATYRPSKLLRIWELLQVWKTRSLGQRLQGLQLLPPPLLPAQIYNLCHNLHALPQILQEPDFKELDDLEGYIKFADVLQVLIMNSFEIDESIGKNKNVKGNLKKNLEFWEFIGTSSFILNVIKLGYRLPFWDVPPAYCSKSNLSAFKNFEFVESSIAELLLSLIHI